MPPARKFSWSLFIWLSILFAVGNLLFANLFVQLVGFVGLPMGLAVSGSMTLLVALFLIRRKADPAESVRAAPPS